MARLNVMKTIEMARKQIPHRYVMTAGTISELYDKNLDSPFDMLVDGFYLGFAQGMKAAKAKYKKRGV